MYSLTNENDDYYCHVICDCGRKFRAEEMYLCYYCNKILCRFCVNIEYEYYSCKSNCKRNQKLPPVEARKKKNCCDLCLECPLCFTSLVKKCYNKKYMYACPYCYWDTSSIKFARERQEELDILIGQVQETSCNGYLRKMYTYCLNKLKGQDNIFYEDKEYTQKNNIRGSISNTVNDVVKKAMNVESWNMEKLDEKIKKYEEEMKKKNNPIYEDDYLNNKDSNYYAFQIISTLLSCSIDYLDNKFSQIDSLESLKSKLKNELDLYSVTRLEQRINNITFQHPINTIQFLKFVDLIPSRAKMSKKCKICKKLVVQAAEVPESKNSGIKLEFSHLFLQQFPMITIFKIDTVTKTLMLKFSMFDFKEVTISFREDPDSPTKVILPPDSYEIGTSTEVDTNEYLFSKSDKVIILNFKFKEEYLPQLQDGTHHFLRFFIKARYDRGGTETTSELEYPNEIKFKFTLPVPEQQ